jgi:O-succinylhomoserine sulfhydrylase
MLRTQVPHLPKKKNVTSIAVTANPNTNEFVEKVCKMEGAKAGFAFALAV